MKTPVTENQWLAAEFWSPLCEAVQRRQNARPRRLTRVRRVGADAPAHAGRAVPRGARGELGDQAELVGIGVFERGLLKPQVVFAAAARPE